MKLKIALLLSSIFLLSAAMTCESDEGDYEESFANLTDIEAFNVNNEGEFPVVSDEPVKKEAYMIAMKRITDNEGQLYYTLNDTIDTEKIYCLTDIDAEHPAGSDVTSFFRKVSYRPEKTDYCFALMKVVAPATYSFKVVISCVDGKVFEASTTPINLY